MNTQSRNNQQNIKTQWTTTQEHSTHNQDKSTKKTIKIQERINKQSRTINQQRQDSSNNNQEKDTSKTNEQSRKSTTPEQINRQIKKQSRKQSIQIQERPASRFRAETLVPLHCCCGGRSWGPSDDGRTHDFPSGCRRFRFCCRLLHNVFLPFLFFLWQKNPKANQEASTTNQEQINKISRKKKNNNNKSRTNH